ncbi:MAG: EVE domain-containing protein [Gemmatimonadetes bacterium]|nr:EVE domain-containing protein [Gemmatimonadota bacterium]
MKSEPGSYSLDDLERDRNTCWEGVRNYQARNLMREMRTGDLVLFYHSNADPPGAAGIARVEREAYPDHLSWDQASRYFDPKSSPDEPRWWMVDLRFVERFIRFVPLAELKAHPALAGMLVTGKSRLSVQPVDAADFDTVVGLGREGS